MPDANPAGPSIFFSVWVNDEATKADKIFYNMHAYGPLTLMQEWEKPDPEKVGQTVHKLVRLLLKMAFIIDDLLDERKHKDKKR
ncbi:MAG: hypothetical protein ABJB86_17065 [Bacteroidota bacterium]